MRELLAHVPAIVKSDPPTGGSLVGELGNESGMTPLHFAAYSGNENVVRLLLNSVGVQVDAASSENVSSRNRGIRKNETKWKRIISKLKYSRARKLLRIKIF